MRIRRITMHHLMATLHSTRRTNGQALHRIAFGQSAGRRVAVLQPRCVAGVVGFDLGVGLGIAKASVQNFRGTSSGESIVKGDVWLDIIHSTFYI